MNTENKEFTNLTCDINTGICGPVTQSTENKENNKSLFEIVDLTNLKEEVQK